jgi:hypothetical protein
MVCRATEFQSAYNPMAWECLPLSDFAMSGAHMRITVWLVGILTAAMFIAGCSDNRIDNAPALKFLQGIQAGDKNKMYEAANLTEDVVKDSREKIIHPRQFSLTDQQRLDAGHALRISGEIDFYSLKLKKMLPTTARFQITKTNTSDSNKDAKNTVHFVSIAYGNKGEALTDRTGRTVKEMVVHLQQATRMINGRMVHEFSFNSEDAGKIADRNFEVKSYF